jgi:5-methylcytosine-specific restriction protein A
MSPSAPLRPCATPLCGALVQRGHCPAHSQQREHQRANFDTRRWYRTARWARLRAQVLTADPLCQDCKAEGRIAMATDVHHKRKHNGDAALFWARENLEGLCSSHHSAHTARGE